MWKYTKVTREEFEQIKDHVEEILEELGCKKIDISLPYEKNISLHISSGFTETWHSKRSIWEYEGQYYRVNEVLFSKPHIVLEVAETLDEVVKNIMEDIEPFPYDLPEDELLLELKRELEIEH